MKRLLIRLLAAIVMVGAGASLANAQSLAGTVRDTSGAVLPGVTIEASSPALITKSDPASPTAPSRSGFRICRHP